MEAAPTNEAELEERLTTPSPELVDTLARLSGDLVVVGAGGKMGPTLSVRAARALRQARCSSQVVAVSRFRDPVVRARLESWGVRTLALDLEKEGSLAQLPPARAVVYMVGQKFGTREDPVRTWAVNALLAAQVAQRYAGVPFVAFSTGNVYPLQPLTLGGSREEDPPAPVGEYAQSALGRERLLEAVARATGTPMVLLRLNYAVELRYGVLVDIALAVWQGRPVDVSMGAVNVLWQGDACDMALRSLSLAQVPPLVLNLTGPETLSVRRLAQQFGAFLKREVRIEGSEAETALISDASRAFTLFGYPQVPAAVVVEWTAQWLRRGGVVWERPTHFSEREGRF
jgi:nucleoside-diphosphate-sugar epimerase